MTISDKHFRRVGSDYAKALMALLPRGVAWNRDSNSTLSKLVNGLAEIYGYVDDRAADLLEVETDPRLTTEMLEDWERNWGLPDICFTADQTEAERRSTLVAKMTLEGAQSRAFYEQIAISLGEMNIDIREYAPYMCGVSRVGDTRGIDDSVDFRWRLGRKETRFYWRVSIDNVLSGAECILNRLRPSHTQLVVRYDSVLDRTVSMYPYLGV